MENLTAKQLFDEQFKFSLNQEVRHKGDNKHGMSSDMGLLIISRKLEENSDDDGNTHFTRIYVCRMIRFSGSGDLAAFKESELLTIEDYNRKAIKEEEERDFMRNEMHQTKKDVYKSFGVTKDSEVFLIKEDGTDKSKRYRVSGFRQNQEGTVLTLREKSGEGSKCGSVEVKSKSEFVVISGND